MIRFSAQCPDGAPRLNPTITMPPSSRARELKAQPSARARGGVSGCGAYIASWAPLRGAEFSATLEAIRVVVGPTRARSGIRRMRRFCLRCQCCTRARGETRVVFGRPKDWGYIHARTGRVVRYCSGTALSGLHPRAHG